MKFEKKEGELILKLAMSFRQVFVKINCQRFYLWRAVDHERDVILEKLKETEYNSPLETYEAGYIVV